MKIAILTIGTRGDVQPYAVLGKALKQRGHEVILASAKNFKELVLSYGIEFLPVEADFQALLDSDEGKKMMKANPFAIKRNLNKIIYPLIDNSLSTFYTLALTSDKVIYHVKTLADSFADQFPEKMIRASVIPIVEPTNEFANPSFSGIPIPRFLNKLSYTISNMSIKLLSKPIGKVRKSFGLKEDFKVPEVKNIYGISSLLIEEPKDYPESSKFTGFWYGTAENDVSDEIKDFIKKGEPPLLLTFGSMPFKCKFDLQEAILKVVNQLKVRFIVVRGWGLQETERLEQSEGVKVIQAAPYEKLFPMVKAVIHHGGIGTTSECLRAGKPFLVCPILYPIGDQKFWGMISYKKGIAVKPAPLKTMNEKVFIKKVRELLENQRLYFNAEKLAKYIKQEDGKEKAVKEIENLRLFNLEENPGPG